VVSNSREVERLRYHVYVARWLSWAILAAGLLRGQPVSHRVGFRDLPPGIARRFDPATFDARIQAIELDTARRESEGELDHLVYYALQSQRFTSLARIEPAVSAREFVEKGAFPEAARARLQAFLRALAHPATDPRLRYFAGLLLSQQRTLEFLEGEYGRVMRFLYDKEFLRREHVYENRGHSTDTQVEANYAVWNALSVLKQLAPETRLQRVLIVGPGLDFAPRTALVDTQPPQSFQPYTVADALLSLGLAHRGQLAIDCGDINARVLDFIRNFPRGQRRLDLYSERGDAEYNRYFHSLGGAIGRAAGKTLRVDADIARAVRAAPLNILTSRWDSSYDLVIATNVLIYFNSDELALAHANVAAMLPRGGYFLHNELRPELDELAASVSLDPVQARTIRISEGRLGPLFDTFVLYRKRE
jgi:hypothetical protein